MRKLGLLVGVLLGVVLVAGLGVAWSAVAVARGARQLVSPRRHPVGAYRFVRWFPGREPVLCEILAACPGGRYRVRGSGTPYTTVVPASKIVS